MSKAAADDIARYEAAGRVDIKKRLADWFGRALVVVAIGCCLKMGQPIVHELAGKDTKVDFVAQLGWGWGFVSSLGWANERRRRKLGNTDDVPREEAVRSASRRKGEVTA